MSGSDYEDDQEASTQVGGSGVTRTEFDLGSASEWVSGTSVNWSGLVSYLATIAVLIVAETYARIVSGLFALPRMGIDAVGDAYADIAGESIGGWPSVFESSFETASASIGDLGLLGFLAAVVVVLVWFLVLNEVFEVI
ncbi:hypothetical protein [Halorubrum sp. F4]|uniref:hypothetical protein n=1 Tax=Halorubrum sp. F4 TaxID=2989715 RepID=UPI0024803F63|nr:hypothetical protein [Halorubrum sp. F4]